MNKERKPTRLKEFDYSQNGAYFITICVKNMKCLLSSIVGDGDPDVPQVKLSKYGSIVEENVVEMNIRYNDIKFEKYVIMPNHIHMIIVIETKGASGSPLPTNSKISRHIGTLKRFCNKQFGENIWQTGFYDHII